MPVSHDEILALRGPLHIACGCIFLLFASSIILLSCGWIVGTKRFSRGKRLDVSCVIILFISLFSSLSSFYQWGILSDAEGLQSEQFVLDMSQHFEFACTFPLMQLALVVLGGKSLPVYRLISMPLLAIATLGIGLASSVIFVDDGSLRASANIISSIPLFYWNWVQTREVSRREKEFACSFKVATLIVFFAWAPFPMWYSLSPHGFGVISDLSIIRAGWTLQNMLAKVSFVMCVQAMKWKYHKAFRTNIKENGHSWKCRTTDYFPSPYETIEFDHLIRETLTFLGIQTNIDRLLALLKQAEVRSCSDLDKLDLLDCQELFLPVAVVYAVQQRLRARRNGAACGAIDIGEKHLQPDIPEHCGTLGTADIEKGLLQQDIAGCHSTSLLHQSADAQSDGAEKLQVLQPLREETFDSEESKASHLQVPQLLMEEPLDAELEKARLPQVNQLLMEDTFDFEMEKEPEVFSHWMLASTPRKHVDEVDEEPPVSPLLKSGRSSKRIAVEVNAAAPSFLHIREADHDFGVLPPPPLSSLQPQIILAPPEEGDVFTNVTSAHDGDLDKTPEAEDESALVLKEADKEHAAAVLSEAICGVADSVSIDGLRQAIHDARIAGVDSDTLDTAQSRLEELSWEFVADFVSTWLISLLTTSDTGEVQELLEVGGVAMNMTPHRVHGMLSQAVPQVRTRLMERETFHGKSEGNQRRLIAEKLVHKGNALFRSEKYNQAVRAYNKAVQLQPDIFREKALPQAFMSPAAKERVEHEKHKNKVDVGDLSSESTTEGTAIGCCSTRQGSGESQQSLTPCFLNEDLSSSSNEGAPIELTNSSPPAMPHGVIRM